MWNPFASTDPLPREQPQESPEDIEKRRQAEQDIMYYISGSVFHSDDKFVLYFRSVTGIVSSQMALTLAIGFMSYESKGIRWILQSWIVELIGLIFFLAALCWLLTQKETRIKEPQNMQIMFAFILGLALFLTNLFNEWDHLSMLLLLVSLSMGTFSIFAGSMLCKDISELD